MVLPVLKRCCGCLSLEAGSVIMSIACAALCMAAIALGSMKLPQHRDRMNEDNLILMSVVMFSTLSAISNVVVLLGIIRNRPGYLQLSLMSNSVFLLCILMVALVACIFSPGLGEYLESAGYIVLVVVLLVAGAVYSLYYLTVVNSLYAKMKTTYCNSAIPM